MPRSSLSNPEVRRNIPGASGCAEGHQARVLVTAPPGALPLLYCCWGPRLSKMESHPELQILTTSYRDTALRRGDMLNRSNAVGLRWSQREVCSHSTQGERRVSDLLLITGFLPVIALRWRGSSGNLQTIKDLGPGPELPGPSRRRPPRPRPWHSRPAGPRIARPLPVRPP